MAVTDCNKVTNSVTEKDNAVTETKVIRIFVTDYEVLLQTKEKLLHDCNICYTIPEIVTRIIKFVTENKDFCNRLLQKDDVVTTTVTKNNDVVTECNSCNTQQSNQPNRDYLSLTDIYRDWWTNQIKNKIQNVIWDNTTKEWQL